MHRYKLLQRKFVQCALVKSIEWRLFQYEPARKNFQYNPVLIKDTRGHYKTFNRSSHIPYAQRFLARYRSVLNISSIEHNEA